MSFHGISDHGSVSPLLPWARVGLHRSLSDFGYRPPSHYLQHHPQHPHQLRNQLAPTHLDLVRTNGDLGAILRQPLGEASGNQTSVPTCQPQQHHDFTLCHVPDYSMALAMSGATQGMNHCELDLSLPMATSQSQSASRPQLVTPLSTPTSVVSQPTHHTSSDSQAECAVPQSLKLGSTGHLRPKKNGSTTAPLSSSSSSSPSSIRAGIHSGLNPLYVWSAPFMNYRNKQRQKQTSDRQVWPQLMEDIFVDCK